MNIFLRNSIFNNTTELNGFLYIHFPLIYKTSNFLYIQIYCDAVCELFKILSLEKSVYLKQIDKLVIEFSSSDRDKIHLNLINSFGDRNFLCKINEKLRQYSKKLPELVDEWEKNIYSGKKTSKEIFKRIYKILKYFLAVNYSNCITETYLPQYLKSEKASYYNSYLVKNAFSHIKYFNEQKAQAKKDILTFSRNIGFLSNETGEPTEYEDCEFLSKESGRKIKAKEILSGKFEYPEMKFDEQDIISSDVPEVLNLAKLLQISLEIRHYWLLRLARNLRIAVNSDKTIINTWLYKDYEKELFSIK